MSVPEVNNNIYSPYTDKINRYKNPAGKFLAATTTPKIPEIRDTFVKKKASEDGKFSWLEFGKNVVKGVGLFAVDIVKNVIKNPLFSIGTFAVLAAVASSPLGVSLLAGLGMASVLFGGTLLGIKAATHAVNGNWDELEKVGTKFGKLIPAGLISGYGAIKGVSMLSKAADSARKISKLQSIKKALELDAKITGAYIKNVTSTVFTGVKTLFTKPGNLFKKNTWKEAWTFKSDYQKTVNGLNDKLFAPKEITYLNDKAKLFDWSYRNIHKTFPVALKGLGDT